jgi:hypothetical protein
MNRRMQHALNSKRVYVLSAVKNRVGYSGFWNMFRSMRITILTSRVDDGWAREKREKGNEILKTFDR